MTSPLDRRPTGAPRKPNCVRSIGERRPSGHRYQWTRSRYQEDFNHTNRIPSPRYSSDTWRVKALYETLCATLDNGVDGVVPARWCVALGLTFAEHAMDVADIAIELFLRNAASDLPLGGFAVTELGGETRRLHAHAVLLAGTAEGTERLLDEWASIGAANCGWIDVPWGPKRWKRWGLPGSYLPHRFDLQAEGRRSLANALRYATKPDDHRAALRRRVIGSGGMERLWALLVASSSTPRLPERIRSLSASTGTLRRCQACGGPVTSRRRHACSDACRKLVSDAKVAEVVLEDAAECGCPADLCFPPPDGPTLHPLAAAIDDYRERFAIAREHGRLSSVAAHRVACAEIGIASRRHLPGWRAPGMPD